MQSVLAMTIFLLTLTLVFWQPRGLGIGFSALGGALLALATGVITWENIPQVWAIMWNATFTFVALIVITHILDEAGFFRWVALHVAHWGQGNGWLLFHLIVILGAATAASFANTSAALVLTPIVIEMLLVFRFERESTLAFVMATGFIYDATSLPLIVSNLVNIVSANYFNISFGHYALVMVPVNFVTLAISLCVVWLYFWLSVPLTYNLANLVQPSSAIRDPLVFNWSFPILFLLLAGYFLAEPLGLPVSAVAGLGAFVLLALAGRLIGKKYTTPVISVRKVLGEAPWQVVLFSLGMYLVVFGLRNAGLTAILSQVLQNMARQGFLIATVGTGFLAAFLSSIMNNMPTVLINALAIEESQVIDPVVREAMVYANVIGCDLGSKITPIGSLATLLWLHILARKGLQVSWAKYFRVGIVLTLPVLLVTLLCLVSWLSWLTPGSNFEVRKIRDLLWQF